MCVRRMILVAALGLAACGGSSGTTSQAGPEAPIVRPAPVTSAPITIDPTETTIAPIIPAETAPATVVPAEPTTSVEPATTTATASDEVLRLVPEVVATIPRGTEAFTQGLEVVGDRVVESSGLYGESFLRLVDPATWEELAVVDLPTSVFGEGATVVDDRIIVLTWQEQRALVHALDDLRPVGELSYETQGWGLCELDDGRLAMSDGTATITFRDPDDFAASGRITVALDGEPIGLLNELECVGDDIWANVWQTDHILRIDAASGRVEAVVDAGGLLEPDPAAADPDAVLNGIAHLGDDRFLVTGKRWPAVFEVRFVADG